MSGRQRWRRAELLVAFSLYCQLSFGKLHSKNPEIIKHAKLIGRTPAALAMKLCNIASLDNTIIVTGRKGLSGSYLKIKQAKLMSLNLLKLPYGTHRQAMEQA